jgi:HlyD family secretion protein
MAVLFAAVGDAKQVQPDMTVHLAPATASADQYGALLGQVRYVSPFPASSLRLQTLLGDPDLAQFVARDGPVHEVAVVLNRDTTTPSGFQWSSGSGPPIRLTSGTLTTADIVLGERRPLGLVLPVFDR